MNNWLPQATVLIQSLGWALLHSLWQCLLIYGCLRLVLFLSGTASARIKYHLSIAALAAAFVWFVNTCITQWERLQAVTIRVTQSGSDPSATKTFSITTLPSNTQTGKLLNGVIATLEHYFPLMVGLYIAGIAFLLMRFLINLFQVRNLRTKGLTAVDTSLQQLMQQWQEELGITRRVLLSFSERINIPMTVGALKPIILLPIASINNLTRDQLEAILLHELAHIKRHDYLLNILQTIIETVLFFNPFVWLISRVIRKEREHCCDDIVISYLSVPLPYARALAALEAHRHSNSIAMAATGNKQQLLHRIVRIMEMKKKPVNYTQFGIATLIITALIVSIAWFTPAFAQTKKTVTKDKNGNTTTTTTSKKTDKKGNKSVSHTIVVTKDVKDGSNNDGVHPNDVGNEEHVNKIVKDAMNNIDWKGVGSVVNQSMACVDWDQMSEDVKEAVSGIDWDEVRINMDQARKEMDVAKIDMAQAKKDMALAKIEMLRAREELAGVDWDQIQETVEASLEEARKHLDNIPPVPPAPGVAVIPLQKQVIIEKQNANGRAPKAKAYVLDDGRRGRATRAVAYNSKDYQAMLDEMDEDGLINKDKSFKIRKENGELYINGKKQNADVYKRYSGYLDAKEVNISGDENNMNINIQN